MGLKSRTKGRSVVRIEANGETHSEKEVQFDYPHDTPASRVTFAVGVRRSENYQSVSMEARVEIPCHPGQEKAAGDFCADKCAALLQDNEGDLDSLPHSLS